MDPNSETLHRIVEAMEKQAKAFDIGEAILLVMVRQANALDSIAERYVEISGNGGEKNTFRCSGSQIPKWSTVLVCPVWCPPPGPVRTSIARIPPCRGLISRSTPAFGESDLYTSQPFSKRYDATISSPMAPTVPVQIFAGAKVTLSHACLHSKEQTST